MLLKALLCDVGVLRAKPVGVAASRRRMHCSFGFRGWGLGEFKVRPIRRAEMPCMQL